MPITPNRDWTSKPTAQAPTELSEEALRHHENLPTPAQRVGEPRLDPFNAILYNFYEPLVLFEILQRSLGCLKPVHTSEAKDDEKSSPWRDFLNQLSWLCDYKHGGDTSSVIAVEATLSGPKYWVAANFDKKHKGPGHLQDILEKLSELEEFPDRCEAILNDVLELCLNFSFEKFENYRLLLLNNIRVAKESVLNAPESLEATLLLDLENVSGEMGALELSELAFRYVKSDTVREVHAMHRDKAPRQAGSAWDNICHYIGRLGAWERAVRVVVHFAKEQPRVLDRFRVDSVLAPKPIKPPPADHQTHLEAVLKRMLPREEGRVEALLTKLRLAMAPGFDLDEAFTHKYESKTFRPRNHAELLLLEHFSTQKLPFFHNDKFVGSSKPSCYCCNLYFKLHTGGISTRPTHGNVWHRWCLPPELMEDDKRKFNWDGKTILRGMTRQIRSDVLALVENGLPGRARMQDSTTGMWTAPNLGLHFI